MWPTARLLYLLPSEFPLKVDNLSFMTFFRFPNPVPAGIYVPHWAILDVTVCIEVLSYGAP